MSNSTQEKCAECDGLGYDVKYVDTYNCGDISSPYEVPCEECAALAKAAP